MFQDPEVTTETKEKVATETSEKATQVEDDGQCHCVCHEKENTETEVKKEEKQELTPEEEGYQLLCAGMYTASPEHFFYLFKNFRTFIIIYDID